jgi:hypothetical protein
MVYSDVSALLKIHKIMRVIICGEAKNKFEKPLKDSAQNQLLTTTNLRP